MAVAQDFPRAQYNLACCYEQGIGVKADLEEAYRLLRLAVASGESSIAEYKLGIIYEQGNEYVRQDINEARCLYQRAALKGNPKAKIKLE